MEYNLYELERWSLLLIGMGFTAGLIGGWILNEIMTEYEQRKKAERWVKKHKARREEDYLDRKALEESYERRWRSREGVQK